MTSNEKIRDMWIKLYTEMAKDVELVRASILKNPDSWEYRAYMFKWGNRHGV